jgi:hypothetical protein
MNDSPGWASPGSSPSDEPEHGGSPDTPQPAAPPNWSNQQPPPGQWSAPSGRPIPPPPPPPGPGWGARWSTPQQGAPQGWQQPSWGKPPSPKPGVIPLRPLGVGEILDGAVSTMRAHWRTVLGISLIVALIIQTTVVLFQGFVLKGVDTTALNDPNASVQDVLSALRSSLITGGVAGLIELLGTIVATAMLTMVVSRAVLGRPVTTGEAWQDAAPRLLRLLGLTLLLPLIALVIMGVCALPGILVAIAGSGVTGAGIAAIGILPGAVVSIWLMIRFSLASPALMLEKQGIFKSIARSVKLVRGSWWRVFGVQALAAILVSIVAGIITLPFSFLAMALSGDGGTNFLSGNPGTYGWTYFVVSGIGSVIGSTITLPISAGVTALLYVDRRIRREGLDIELARAANVPGYAGTSTATPADSTTPGG